MKKEWRDVISKELGVEPIEINSSLLSGQNRPRLYWTNIPNITIRNLTDTEIEEPEAMTMPGAGRPKR